jgi:dienelactone hydrolase
MRKAASFLFATVYMSAATIPAADSRNVTVPNTDTAFTPREYKTRAEWEARAAHLRRQILFSAGLMPMPPKTPLNAQVFGRIERRDYSVEKVLIETLPGYWLGGNLYQPVGKTGPFPAIVSPHGHWTYGRLENSANASIPARCINLARQGYIVFAYDMVGYNDTLQTPHAFGGRREQLWGFGPLGLQLWNSIRAVDFVESLADTDRAKIGATGASGGATQTMLLAAVDRRIRFSSPVNMISSIMQGGSPCENASGLRVGTNNMEIGALMAPRPMLMVAATGDWTKNTPKVEHPAVQSIYKLLDAEVNLEMVQFDAPHNYNKDSREAVYKFFAKHALGADAKSPEFAKTFSEKGSSPEKLQDLLALHNRTLPRGALGLDALVTQWIEMARAQNAAEAPSVERLTLALASEWPAKVLAEKTEDRVVLSREGVGDRVAAVWIEGKMPAAIVVHPDGADAGRKLVEKGRATLLVTAFQTGESRGPRDQSHTHFLTFNKSDDAERVQDILTSLAWMKQEGKLDGASLSCTGDAAVWCTFAAAVAPVKVELKAEAVDFLAKDADFLNRFFVPGIQRAGGWDAAKKLAADARR